MKDIEQFLRDNAPDTPEEGQFLIETNARLDQVEGIKTTVEREHRHWRVILIVTLATGLVLGCLVTALVMLCPAQAGESFLSKAIQAMQQGKAFLFGFVSLCALALGVLSLTRQRVFHL